MNIALLGYGRMGKAIEKIARERGHSIGYILDKEHQEGSLNHIDIAINFSIPSAAVENILEAFDHGIPVVCGTTGWLEKQASVNTACLAKNTAFLYASNFSIGVNLFFKLNQQLAALMNSQNDHYSAQIEETHHIHKLDAPSGTAITLAEGIIDQNEAYSSWAMEKKENAIKIQSYREGEVPGNHRIIYTSGVDEIHIEHKAHSRDGFALGAVIAAEWLKGKKGIYSMQDVLNL